MTMKQLSQHFAVMKLWQNFGWTLLKVELLVFCQNYQQKNNITSTQGVISLIHIQKLVI